ncbi:MAG: L-2-hydroxyglutarate oxidase [Candidatus Nanopelagicales bacterium]
MSPRSASGSGDVVVVGGGIVGLAVADALLARDPDLTVRVLEKEPRLAAHASGRNSGVLHAGFYYSPDSLKARLTRRGNVLLHAFCEEAGVAVRRCGKVVVARSEDELPALAQLLRRGEANGVPLERVDEQGLRELEPRAVTHRAAIWSPTTSVADPAAVVEALAARVRARGGDVRLGVAVVGAAPGLVRTTTGTIAAGHVVNTAGLYADRLASWFGQCDDYVMLPFKGLYWYADLPPGWLTRHVYPVPDPRNPFLGVHLTVTVDGRVKVGPTAIPALRREDYGRVPGLARHESGEIARALPRFLRSPHHDVPALLRSEVPKYSRRWLVHRACALVDDLPERAFRVRGRPGVRAQLLHRESGRLEMDFVVRGDDRSTHVLNAVSPGWTSALAVGEHVASVVLAS